LISTKKYWRKKYFAEYKQPLDIDRLYFGERIQMLLKYSTYFIFGAEESYGYLIGDKVRDKDANLACALFCEMAAYLKLQNVSILHHLNQIYAKYGYFTEDVLSINYDGVVGAQKIQKILNSYRSNRPEKFGEHRVTNFHDFGRDTIKDADGCVIPKQDFYKLELSNGFSFAVRGSGTEPKIKFYFFAKSNKKPQRCSFRRDFDQENKRRIKSVERPRTSRRKATRRIYITQLKLRQYNHIKGN
jgi:phosphoglucomutase